MSRGLQYPIRAAAKATGLPVETLRAWERRYQAVTPGRSARGRSYGDAEIQRLLLLRDAVAGGRAIGQVARLSNSELAGLSRQAERYGVAGPARPKVDLEGVLDSILAYDSDAVTDELSRLALLLRPEELVHHVVLPLMRLAGERWDGGGLKTAHEHLLSACVRNLMGTLMRLRRNHGGTGSLLFTTPAGELHEFGILAAAMLALAHGFRVAYLGPNLPAQEILAAVSGHAPRAVVLGVMKINATAVVRQDVRRLASRLPNSVELWLGGSGAAAASRGIIRDSVLRLDEFAAFEHHLARLSSTSG